MIRPFRILTVCTGNICRSPLAERLLQHGLDAVSPGAFSVASAGTGALVGSGMDPHIQGYARVFGASPDGFVSRQLTSAVLAGQDLVLALTREHRSKIVELQPSLLKMTFSLRELARVLPGIDGDPALEPPERWRMALVRALRARTPPTGTPEDDDVVDPFRRSDETYEQMLHQLSPAVQALIKWERRYSQGA